MNIDLLQGPLPVTENPGLETIDPRLSDIATLVEEGRYEEAAAESEAILKEEIYDIRIIGYFLYGLFLEQGLGATSAVYDCLTCCLRDNLEAIGPAKNREKHIQTVLNWVMKQLLKRVQYEEEKKGSCYECWLSEVSSDQVQEALDAADALRRTLGPVLEDTAGPVLDGLMKMNDWLGGFQRLVYREPEIEEEAAEEEVEEGEAVPEAKGLRISIPGMDDEVMGVEGSYPLKLLIRKLHAFDRLIAGKKYPSAALVADDINSIIANFDPKVYFPKLFTRFSLQLAAHINELVSCEEYKNTVGWQAMQELYKVDLDSFVNFDTDAIDLGTSGPSGEYGEQEEYEDMEEEDNE